MISTLTKPFPGTLQKGGAPFQTTRWIIVMRQRYRQCLRMEVASTVFDPADVDEELHYLYEILLR